jgi:hypothetical protein
VDLANYVAQDAQRNAWFPTRIDRVADPMERTFRGFGEFRGGGLRLWRGI